VRDIVQSTLHRRYHLERELGKGGMGTVYLAVDLQLQRSVAIKVLPPELAVRPELRERFLRETRLAAGFSHPNIVPVHAVEEHPQLLCFVMGYVEGETLGQRVRRAGPLGAADAARLLQEVAWALSYAHGRGVVHRDIKPDNILLERSTGRALVTDFGIARSNAPDASHLTQVGEVVGTPPFMSPEQAAGERLDGRSDLYSLGVVAFFAVTGRLPFEAEGAAAVMAMHLTQVPPRVASLRADLPQPLCAAIDRCLEKDPARRFENGEALAAALGPMRAARREVAPAVRMFQLQANQGVRAFLVVIAVSALMVTGAQATDTVARLLAGILGAAVLWGIFAQLVGRARYLQGLGFTFDEVRDGLGVILEERAEARAQERANPRARRREDLRTRVMLLAFIGSIAGGELVARMRVQVAPHSYRVGIPGIIIAAASTVLFGLAIAFLMMNPARATGVDRLIAWLWTGPFGRALFRLAAWRLDEADAGAASFTSAATSAPLALIAALPRATRRALGSARERIEQMEQALGALAERQRHVESALADAGGSSAPTDPGLRTRRAELVSGLSSARDAAIVSRERLASALENVRLQLLRLRSGVGTVADVVAELSAAERFAGAREPAAPAGNGALAC
jgi:serine/threonine-protein kinase